MEPTWGLYIYTSNAAALYVLLLGDFWGGSPEIETLNVFSGFFLYDLIYDKKCVDFFFFFFFFVYNFGVPTQFLIV